MAFATLAEMLEAIQALEQDVRERDETLTAMQGHVNELASFRQEALTARETIERQRLQIEQLTDQLAKSQSAVAEHRSETDRLRRQADEDAALLHEAREISESVKQLAAKVSR